MKPPASGRVVAGFVSAFCLGMIAFAVWGGGWARLLYWPLCHQVSERCFHFGGDAIALCSRCSGIYLGIGLLSGMYSLLGYKGRRSAMLLSLAVGANLLDFGAETLGLVGDTLWWRFGDGLLLGGAIAFLVLPRLMPKNPPKLVQIH